MNEPAEQQQLHAFCLPEQTINSLQYTNNNNYTDQPETTEPETERKETANENLSSFSCTVCNTSFDSNDLQREHFRSDWHRFNLKLTTAASHKKPIDHRLGFKSSKNFKQSASTSLEDRFQEMLSSSTQPDSSEPIRLLSPAASPLLWFTLSAGQEPSAATVSEEEQIVQLGFYRAIFPNSFPRDRSLAPNQDELGTTYRTELAALQRPFLPPNFSPDITSEPSLPPTWTIIMIGGGHFAAMVVSTIPKLRHVSKNKAPEIEPVILHHKTFHRYTTRRKQGGGQASHDAGGKGAAKSAGASLRRYNEQALSQDIQDLLKAWDEPISHSDLVFIRSSKSNLKTLFKSKDETGGCKLTRGDPRVRSLPFVTKRPTFNELKRCFNELTRVKIFKTTRGEMKMKEQTMREIYEREKARREQQAAKKAEQEARQRAEEERKRAERMEQKREKTDAEKAQELEDSRWERVIEMVKKGKLEALQEFVGKHSETDWFGQLPARVTGRAEVSGGVVSLLQLASMSDHPGLVEWLLSTTTSDPTMVAPERTGTSKAHLTPYELAASRLVRNVFRRAMATNPTQYDWLAKAKVPSPLTEELEATQNSKNKEWNRKLKEKLKERDRVRAENEKLLQAQAAAAKQEETKARAPKVSSATANRLDGGSVARKSNVVSANAVAGLSEEQRARLERERRARAAEARLR
ncbi:hypothetical protein PtA15_4A810 [Puccinia triticina]|uniref:VLRF1 domain-containing protein n=1 Tax=Puccinia triticina TaxID=208348 RepID=A0ABY7CNK0_9BASI|nr:uncharacterized protein PtA15_4A810 [Puccinia triticina]WAQ84357.1 hypothetical protein PtA15_4A810 [Puccinia triticina]WAR55191.1 hypothetical protein PtB15_4B811 [Puccinia triticina]